MPEFPDVATSRRAPVSCWSTETNCSTWACSPSVLPTASSCSLESSSPSATAAPRHASRRAAPISRGAPRCTCRASTRCEPRPLSCSMRVSRSRPRRWHAPLSRRRRKSMLRSRRSAAACSRPGGWLCRVRGTMRSASCVRPMSDSKLAARCTIATRPRPSSAGSVVRCRVTAGQGWPASPVGSRK